MAKFDGSLAHNFYYDVSKSLCTGYLSSVAIKKIERDRLPNDLSSNNLAIYLTGLDDLPVKK